MLSVVPGGRPQPGAQDPAEEAGDLGSASQETGRAAPHPPTTPRWVMTGREDGGTLPHGVTLVLHDILAFTLFTAGSTDRRSSYGQLRSPHCREPRSEHGSLHAPLLGAGPFTLLPDTGSC